MAERPQLRKDVEQVVEDVKEEVKADVAAVKSAVKAETTKLVKMLKFDTDKGTAEEIDVHPAAVKAHQDAGWLVKK